MQLISSGARQRVQPMRFELAADTPPPCPFDHPSKADPPDTTSGGGLASTRADNEGCVDTLVTIPASLSAGTYLLCALATGQPAACAEIQVSAAGSSVALPGGGSIPTSGRGFARTGLELLPWLLAGTAAILVGRELVRRGRSKRTRAVP
jgi:hypothetical protein